MSSTRRGLALKYTYNALRLAAPYSLRMVRLLIKSSRQFITSQGSISDRLYRIIRQHYSKNFRPFVDVCGFKIFLNREDGHDSPVLLTLKCWEPAITALFFALVARGDVVVDVGAFIGYYTLLAAKLVGRRGKVFSFEPNPHSFQLLKAAIMWNGFSNVELYNAAVGNYSGIASFYLREPSRSTLRVEDLSTSNVNVTNVRVLRLDDVIPMNQRITLLKIDAEGSEPDVVEGARELIRKGLIQHIVIEWLGEFWRDRKELIELLASVFDVYQLTETHYLFPRLTFPFRVKLSSTINGMLWLLKK